MCRWNAYIGEPLLIDDLLYRTKHGLIDESLHSRMGAETTNGDGFGLGWYPTDRPDDPARYRSVQPAWNDANLRDLAAHIESHLFLAHIRAAIGSPVQQTNCHPFRHGRWLFVHNGMISGFDRMRRDLMLAVDGDLFSGIGGSADSETLFYLALTEGLEQDPLGAMERAVGTVERCAAEHGVDNPMQGTIGIADGERVWAVRYSSAHESRTLFVSEDVDTVRRLHPENPRLQELSEDARIIVSEPLADLEGAWHAVPESTALAVTRGGLESRPFAPAPAA
jgi:predicted glutamine amidotransferase